MKTSWLLVVGAGFAVGLAACSSSQTTEGEGAEDVPVAEASTDALPTDEAPVTDASAESQPVPDEALPMETAEAPPMETPPPVEAPPADATAMATPPPVEEQAPAPGPETPAPVEPAPAPEVASSGGTDTYTVQHGDTLMKIAFETYGDLYQWKKIYEMNRDKLSSPSAVSHGMILKLDRPLNPVHIDRNGEAYHIVHGDTLGKISTKVYGTKHKWKKIWHNNPQLIRNPHKIFAGFTLYYMPDDSPHKAAPLANKEEQNPAADMSASSVPAPLNETPMPLDSASAPAPVGTDAPRTPAASGTSATAPTTPAAPPATPGS
ncbi:LysM peptidoglycan-binding domain-containing protein [bacterium]|nr:LysM peptidoglycan-binding domain-containing protein [bacterium]